MRIVCDPGRHAIAFRFDQAASMSEGPEIKISGETVGLFVDDVVMPRRLNGILFYRHRFYLPFHITDYFVSDFSLRFSSSAHMVSCSLVMFSENHVDEWKIYRGVDILVRSTVQNGKDRPTLIGFQIDTRILKVEPLSSPLEIDFSSDSLKCN